MPKTNATRAEIARTPTAPVKLFSQLDSATLALERVDSLLATCAAALWHQDCNIDSDVAATIDGAIYEQLEAARKHIQEAMEVAHA